MHADSMFVIGKSHKICQDYTLSSENFSPSFVLLSDGCSSAADTDVGARILLHTVFNELWSSEDANFGSFNSSLKYFPFQKILSFCRNILVDQLELPSTSLDATLLIARTRLSNLFEFLCVGDGVFVKIRKDGKMEVVEIEYPSGAPFYLNYQPTIKIEGAPTRADLYKETFGITRVIKTYVLGEGIESYQESTDQTGDYYYSNGDITEYQAVALMSDGVAHVTDQNNQTIPTWQVLKKFLNFKSYPGEFVQRRMQKFLKEVAEEKWTLQDDLSLAAIYLGK